MVAAGEGSPELNYCILDLYVQGACIIEFAYTVKYTDFFPFKMMFFQPETFCSPHESFNISVSISVRVDVRYLVKQSDIIIIPLLLVLILSCSR